MARTPGGFDEAAEKLDEATTELVSAIRKVDGWPELDPWRKRSNDLSLLKEQIVDIRQQLELLKLEVAREPDTAS